MARYKHTETSPRFLAVYLQRQLLLGKGRYVVELNCLVHKILVHKIEKMAHHGYVGTGQTVGITSTRCRDYLIGCQVETTSANYKAGIKNGMEIPRRFFVLMNGMKRGCLPPAMLLKVILFAHSQGIVSSRRNESVCREHVTFIALSGDTMPHFTTIAAFVSSLASGQT